MFERPHRLFERLHTEGRTFPAHVPTFCPVEAFTYEVDSLHEVHVDMAVYDALDGLSHARRVAFRVYDERHILLCEFGGFVSRYGLTAALLLAGADSRGAALHAAMVADDRRRAEAARGVTATP